jgi:lipopolysaccharide export system protein LptA
MLKVAFLKTLKCKQARSRLASVVIFGLIGWITAGLPASIGMARPRESVQVEQSQRIHIKADKVIADLDGGNARFMGNVRVTRGLTTVTSDQMNVYYKDAENKNKNGEVKSSLRKIIATGNVKIHMEDLIAFTDEAVYITETETLTMSGSNSRVISGENSITGSRFIVSRANGNIVVEGNNQDQVQAVLYPGETSLF